MSQENLKQAMSLLAALPVTAEGQAKLAELKTLLSQATSAGEGQDAEGLRQQIDDMISENAKFTSVMVHEIRKPMTSIRGYSDMLTKNVVGELNEMQSQFAHTIRNNVISMEGLVTDISDLSKMRSGRMQVNNKMEMFKNVSMKLEEKMPELAEARNVTLTFDIPQGLPLLNVDGARVEQALLKLIDNAIKYTNEGEGVIQVVAEGQGDSLKVSVIDNGVGISAEDQSHLGEIFFRGDNDLVMQTKGYGMGIPIAMACIELVGGELFWQSEEGKGSTFGIILPAMS